MSDSNFVNEVNKRRTFRDHLAPQVEPVRHPESPKDTNFNKIKKL